MADETDAGGDAGQARHRSTLRLATQDGALLSESELGGGRGGPPAGGDGGDQEEVPTFASDDAMANVLVQTRLNGNWRYASDGRWYYFNDKCWVHDDTLQVVWLARMVCRATAARCATPGTARMVASGKSISAVERQARNDRTVATPIEMFDRDPWSLNTPLGLVDLRSGELQPHNRDRLCMKMAGASPVPLHEHKQWSRFLHEITGGDQAYQEYLQRLVGYSLVGTTSEEIFVFLYGPSNTGKSKFVECLRLLMGDYGTSAPMNTFETVKGERHPTDLAGFVGCRLITAAETEEGRRWDQQRLTMLTGRDRIKARFMRGDFFEYIPSFILLFHGNYRPRLNHASDAMRRRMHLLPFLHKPPRIDKHLIDKFRAELPGIMAWAVEGCLNWQRDELSPPKIVNQATEEYFAFEDVIGEWLDERCDRTSPDLYASSRELHQDFAQFMAGRGFVPGEAAFVARLEGVEGLRRSMRLPNGRRGFWGVALRHRQPDLPLNGGPKS